MMGSYLLETLKPSPEAPRRILLIGGDYRDYNTRFIFQGILHTLHASLDNGSITSPQELTIFDSIALSSWRAEAAQERFQELFDKHGLPDAILCFADTLAQGVIHVLETENIPPEKFPLIIGQDGIRAATRAIEQGRQSMTVFKDVRLLSAQAATLAELLSTGKEFSIGHTSTDNGVKDVPTFHSPIRLVTKENYKELLLDSGYYTNDIHAPLLPYGFVSISDAIPDSVPDMRYCTANNFTGKPIPGYRAPRPMLTAEAAAALVLAANDLRQQGFRLQIFDAYRPKKATDEFTKWVRKPETFESKQHYPQYTRRELEACGYLPNPSPHSRGSCIDLSLADLQGNPCDMGGDFDFFDPQSTFQKISTLTPLQQENRNRLCEAMMKAGFIPSPRSWWHFQFADEPFPYAYFDFDVE